jgi:hypothetical protein
VTAWVYVSVGGMGHLPTSRVAYRETTTMITITLPDRDTQKKALGFLLVRFSGRVLRSGKLIVPAAALEALANQNIPFTVHGRSTYEEQVGFIRD